MMRQQLEDELERVMRAAGESAPRPDPNLVGQIDERGLRRRRNRLRTVMACGTAVVAVGVAGVAIEVIRPAGFDPAGGDTVQTKPEPKQEPDKPADKARIPLAKDVWPQAVHQIPRKLPDGRTIFPQTFLDADTLLITTQSSFEKSDELYEYDLKTQATEEVAKVDSPGFANDFTVGDGWVVWWANVEDSKRPGTEIWGVPLAGGQARRLVVAPGSGIDFLAVGEGQVHWSYSGKEKQVYSAPLTGDGEAQAIPDSKGYHIVSWPWIGSPGEQMDSRSTTGEEQEILYRTLRNVETGETRTTTNLKGTWSCGLSWCVGMSKDKSYAQRRDGSGRKSFDNVDLRFITAMVPVPVRDRFFVDMSTVADTHTGKTGRLDQEGRTLRALADDRLHYSYIKDGFELIDLAAIE
jgi:hypothetical protein